ncbi:MAG: undecaprenyldiphospho-muramoylpentapeptide beta-N-acetylglucosaminyltransferase [Flavobacteriales bacterium]|nr:undecaprenyldiphospho-muramoylpentapeptide beta-N-acetylglucosaminyltransferase [Flavobacteriales bacterium]
MKSTTSHKILISGGGTGGHIFPAIAIADELKSRFPDAEFLFIGAKDKMEMQKVPQAGYKIEGLWISGINRSNMKQNLVFPFKLISSVWNSYKIIKKFKPTMAIGTGGFASGPALWTAHNLGVPIFLQEQNSFPGITNKFLSKNAKAVCVAYENMDNFFGKSKTHITGNPIRQSIIDSNIDSKEAKGQLNLDENKLCVLSIGGSLGSRKMNQFWEKNLAEITKQNAQVVWQTGKLEFEKYKSFNDNSNALVTEFLQDMSLAYSAADVIISRAGAIAISELCSVGKPTILIPYPFAAEDHQTKNANYLVEKNASIKVSDKEVPTRLVNEITELISNEGKRKLLSENLKNQAKINATKDIVDIILSEV